MGALTIARTSLSSFFDFCRITRARCGVARGGGATVVSSCKTVTACGWPVTCPPGKYGTMSTTSCTINAGDEATGAADMAQIRSRHLTKTATDAALHFFRGREQPARQLRALRLLHGGRLGHGGYCGLRAAPPPLGGAG